MNLEPYQEKVRDWFEKVSLPEIQGEEKPALEVLDLDFSYITGKPILSDIHFRINKGEMLAIVGKNGAGKSTLSNLICGFIHPDHGKILLNGSDIADKSIKERGEAIGLVMQNPNQMISKPMIFDEVALGLRVRGVPEEEVKERVYDKLKICGLYPFRNWPVSALSFGQKKRVTIASILVMNPEILILDEPTAGQDYRHYTEIMEFLKHLNETLGITIIMITHDMHLMLEYTDRAIVIADGELIADDKPAKVLTDEAVADRAYLKKTSLYDLAVRCGIGDASGFAERIDPPFGNPPSGSRFFDRHTGTPPLHFVKNIITAVPYKINRIIPNNIDVIRNSCFPCKYSALSGSYFLLSVILFVCQKEAMILSRKNRETVSFYIHP